MIRDILVPLVSERFLREERYRQGHIRIINALPGRCILGLHVPEMKAVARRIAGSVEAREVIGGFEREHERERFSLCYEETVVWGLTINAMRCGVGERLEMVRRFVPAIDNWGVCDTFCCNTKWAKRVGSGELWEFLQPYFDSDREFEVRFAVVMSMCHLLEEEWLERVFLRLEGLDFERIRSEYVSQKEARRVGCEGRGVALGDSPYYVRMAVAWFFATALAKFPEQTRVFVRSCALPDDVKRLYVRKARESFRTRNVAGCSFGVWECLRVKMYFGVGCLNTLYYICSHNLTIIDMEATVRVQASFRLKADLVEKLKMSAKACNRSLNNFVESVLLEAMYNEPNETTKAAMAEAKSCKAGKAYDSVDELMSDLMK